MAASVVAGGLRYRLNIQQVRPEINHENKYPYINYSGQPSFHTFMYIINREIFSVLSPFFSNQRGLQVAVHVVSPKSSARTPVIRPILKDPSSVDPRFQLVNVYQKGSLLVNLSDSAPSCLPQRSEFQWPNRPWCPD